jgi:MFS family permease
MLGGIGGQAPLAALVEAAGWRGALAGAAGFGVLLAAAIWLVVRDRPPAAAAPLGPAGPTAPALLAGLWAVARRPQIWLLALAAAAMTAPLLSFAGLWGVAWLMQTRGLARPEAAAMTSLMLIGWALGGPVIGTLSDRLGRRRIFLLAGGGLGLVCLAAVLYLPGLSLGLISALFLANGLGLGAMVVAFAMAREGNAAAVSGMAYAFVNCAVTATGAVFQPLIGWLLDLRWEGLLIEGARVYAVEAYRVALGSLIVFLVLGLAAGLGLRETHPKVTGASAS